MKIFNTVVVVGAAVALPAAALGFYASEHLRRAYQKNASELVARTSTAETELVSDADLDHLPQIVRNYLRAAGVVGKPKVCNMKVRFAVRMRSRTQDWFDMTAEQYSSFDTFERHFYLTAKVNGLSTKGYHEYKGDCARMKINLLGLIPLVDADGDMMVKAETVTLFNDMCIMAPAALVDKRIEWEALDSSSVRATFTNRSATVSAVLYFDADAKLVNFVSDDRYDINAKKRYRFSTPLGRYKTINGVTLPTFGNAVWHYPEGTFVYGRFSIESLRYNVTNTSNNS